MARSFFLILFFFFYIISTNIHACNQIERTSLLSFAFTLSSPPNWSSTNCCHWKGITCNKDGWVTHLLLPSEGLKGGIFSSPSSLADLTHLTHLNLSHNSIYGSLETKFFSSLNRLEILDLSYNHLSGELPHSPPSSSIRKLDLSSNRFHGAIPSSVLQHTWNLTSFNVSSNTFSGSIPTSLCLQHSSPLIRLLDFSSNKFNGSISRGLGKCSKLQIFRAGKNNLSGFFPEDIYNATKLEEISLPSNALYGALGDKMINLTNLEILDLSFNQLSGVLPVHFGKLSKLKFLTLDFNYLEGSLPPSLMNCTNLIEIHLAANNLEGDISTLNFSRLSKLTKLDLYSNNFTGIMPTSLYSCSSLKAIRMSQNHLDGQIQPEIASLKSLSFLSLGGGRMINVTGAMKILRGCKSLRTLLFSDSFYGERIPTDDDGMVEFDGFQKLRFLSLASCGLTGQIPAWLSKLKNLEVLILYGNRITGSIPCWLGTDLPRLFQLSLGNNQISGELPKELCRLPRLVYEPTTAVEVDDYVLELPVLDRSGRVTKFMPQRLSSFLPMVALFDNKINGIIPTEIGQLKLAHILDLSGNNFSGSIPDQISELKNLEDLDLSRNQLSGNIPFSLTNLNFLSFFNASNNNLEGPIPTSTRFQSFDAHAFEENPKLCGAPLPNECQHKTGVDVGNNNRQDVDNGLECPWFCAFVALGFVVGFWGVCGSLIAKKAWRYAYFRFVDNVQDWLYVVITVRINRMKRRFRG